MGYVAVDDPDSFWQGGVRPGRVPAGKGLVGEDREARGGEQDHRSDAGIDETVRE